MSQPRVFLVDDHELIRTGIRSELAGSVEICGDADEVDAAIEMILERVPDVVVLDVHMPAGGGIAVVKAVNDKEPSVRFLALSMSDAADDLLDAIYRVAAGDAVFSPRLAGFVLDAFSLEGKHPLPGDVDPDLDLLTSRERQVLRLIARGYSYRDIATELTISAKTVESHVSSVLRKLQLSNRHQLSNWASERHLA